MWTLFHWQLLWKHSPLWYLLKKKTGKRLLEWFLWVNCTPRISALLVYTTHEKHYSRQNASTWATGRTYLFILDFNFFRSSAVWKRPLCFGSCSQLLLHKWVSTWVQKGEKNDANSAHNISWNCLEENLITGKWCPGSSVVLLPSATPHKQSKFCLPVSPAAVCTTIGIFQTSSLLFFKYCFWYFTSFWKQKEK